MAKTIQEAVDYLVKQTMEMNREISSWTITSQDVDEMLGDPKTTPMQRNMLMIIKNNAHSTTKH